MSRFTYAIRFFKLTVAKLHAQLQVAPELLPLHEEAAVLAQVEVEAGIEPVCLAQAAAESAAN